MGSSSTNKPDGDNVAVTDNGNYIVDLHFKAPIKDVNKAASDLKNTVGVVDHGFVRWDELPSHRGRFGWYSSGWHGWRESLVVIFLPFSKKRVLIHNIFEDSVLNTRTRTIQGI